VFASLRIFPLEFVLQANLLQHGHVVIADVLTVLFPTLAICIKLKGVALRT
jgi:hypothetical protein